MSSMRAKMTIVNVASLGTAEVLTFAAVCKSEGYPADGTDENNTFAKFTPSANLHMSITNPALLGVFKPGQTFYVDFTEVE